MTEDQGKKEDQFGFTPEGEAMGYISLEQARVVAMRASRDHPGNYGRRFSGIHMVFNVVEQEEGEDYYVITLSFRPEGDFDGTPGQEQFFIEKEGSVAYRQVLSLPKQAGERRFPLVPVAVGLVVAGIAVVGAVVALGGGDDGGTPDARPTATPAAAPTPTETRPTPTTATPAPTPADKPVTREVPGRVGVTKEPVLTCAPLDPNAEYVGGLSNNTVSVSAEIYATFDRSGCLVSGFFDIDSADLAGSGPLEGRLGPADIAFTVPGRSNDIGMDLVFEGSVDQGELAGTFLVPATGEEGEWYLVAETKPTPTPVPPLADDHGDTAEDATTISLGTVSGNIGQPSDLDFFHIFAEAGDSFIAELHLETHPDTAMALLNDAGDLLELNDDAEGMGLGSRISWTAPAAGDYYLVVGSADTSTDTGSYVLDLSSSEGNGVEDDHGDSPETATFVSEGATFGTISPSDDLDVFGFFAEAGESYVMEVDLDGHPDTYLSLLDGDGFMLEENDDAEGLDGGSRISWTAPYTGDFFLEVRSYDRSTDVGGYVLYLDLVAEPRPTRRPRPTPTSTPLPPLIDGRDPVEFVTDFLSEAIEAERMTLETLDTYYIGLFQTGRPLRDTVTTVNNLSGQGQYKVASFDYDYWNLPDVRVISDNKVEVDSCEVWTNQYHDRYTGDLIETRPADLVPQTITIERLNTGWFVTDIAFYDAPHFCP